MSNTVVRTNVMSLNSHRNLGLVSNQQARASQRLSSGFRVNSAADDAAGLGISEKMRAQIRGLDQASRNGQDGISLIQTAEGAMSTVNEMVIRIRELVVQAANDTNVHAEADDAVGIANSDRVRIQEEINQLMDEIDATAARTEFNTRTLIDGSLAGDRVIPGAVTEAGLTGVEDWVNTLTNLTSLQQEFLTNLINENVGSNLDLDAINAALSAIGAASVAASGDIFASGATSVTSFAGSGLAGALGLVFNPGLTAAEAGSATGVLNSIASFFSGTVFTGGNADGVVNWAQSNAVSVGILASLTTVTGVSNAFSQGLSLVFAALGVASGADGAAMTENIMNLIMADSVVANLEANFTSQDPAGLFGHSGQAGLPITSATFNTWFDTRFGTAAFTDGVWNASAEALLAGTGVTHAATSSVEDDTVTPGNNLWFQVGANRNQGIRLSIEAVGTRELNNIGSAAAVSMEDSEGNVINFTFERLRTRPSGNVEHPMTSAPNSFSDGGVLNLRGEEIQNFIDAIDLALAHVTGERSKLGAMQNRLEFTIENLDISSENLSAANSRIRDADMAREMMRLTQANVLQQAAISMLAQANQAPQSILQLLG